MIKNNNNQGSKDSKPRSWTLSQEEMEDIMVKVNAKLGLSNVTVKRKSDHSVSEATPKEVTFLMKSKKIITTASPVEPKAATANALLKNEVPSPIEDIRNDAVRNRRYISQLYKKLAIAMKAKQPFYFDNDWEESVHRYDPTCGVYFTKFEGQEEFQAHPDSQFVWDGHTGGAGIELTKEEYDAY